MVSTVKDNQETILEDLKAVDFSDAARHETVDKGHGRIERLPNITNLAGEYHPM